MVTEDFSKYQQVYVLSSHHVDYNFQFSCLVNAPDIPGSNLETICFFSTRMLSSREITLADFSRFSREECRWPAGLQAGLFHYFRSWISNSRTSLAYSYTKGSVLGWKKYHNPTKLPACRAFPARHHLEVRFFYPL